jgi:Rps23 Pro-64 3,4-dihydroxylase Tpa1-like proline 4-hydroxylase
MSPNAQLTNDKGESMSMDRLSMSREICRRLDEETDSLMQGWQRSAPINHFILDDVLPMSWAQSIRDAFPSGNQMVRKKSLRELKYVAAQMNNYNPLLEETIYAFQAPEILSRVERLTRLRALEPDDLLYAGGISMMAPGHYLNPHIDNSHDKFRDRYRVLNLLFYVSPGWTEAEGCNLELWADGPTGASKTIVSKFNRLVVMATHRGSWHSVSENVSTMNRCCISNYYFSQFPIGPEDYFHVTSFRGRPEQPIRDLVLRADIFLRMAVRKVFPKGVKENPHFYDKGNGGRRSR